MPYAIKEIFHTLQGEGANAGTAAVFCRFAGCNLWSGREQDRATAVCKFCDTEFVGTDGTGGGKFATAAELADAVLACWESGSNRGSIRGTKANRFVVLTGGEPALQLDAAVIDALHTRKFRIAIETNGTIALPHGIDWICMSPKAGTEIVLRQGNELKLVYPQDGIDPAKYEAWDFEHFFLSPMDGPDRAKNTKLAIEYCMTHPRWRLSIQTHKVLGIR